MQRGGSYQLVIPLYSRHWAHTSKKYSLYLPELDKFEFELIFFRNINNNISTNTKKAYCVLLAQQGGGGGGSLGS